MPNTINAKSGLHKIFLTPQELMNESMDSIKKLAELPKKIEYEAETDEINKIFYEEASQITKKVLAGKSANGRNGAKPLILEKIGKGNRNNELFKKAVFFNNRGFTQEEALFYLGTYNQRYCEPPLSDPDLAKIIDSAFRYERKKDDEGILPSSPEAERTILGAILVDEKVADIIFEKVGLRKPFYEDAHIEIWDVMCDLYEKDVPIDLISLTARLKAKRVFDIIGGDFYLKELVTNVEAKANVEHHLNIILDKYALRQTISTCNRTITNCHTEAEDAGSIITKHESGITSILTEFTKKSVRPLNEVMSDSFDAIEKAYTNKDYLLGVPSGFHDIDKILGGFQDTDMVVLAGRTSQGKTATALNFCVNIANEIPVGYFSLEMSDVQLGQRIIALTSGVNLHSLRRGYISSEDWEKVVSTTKKTGTAPIYIDDTPDLNPFDVRARARHMYNQLGVRFIVIDYLQFLRPIEVRMPREQQVSQAVKAMKTLAKELAIPLMVVSQLSRKTEDRGGSIASKRPQLQDLRESGSIENDADAVMMVFRPEWYGFETWEDDTPCENQIEISVPKHRNGPTGSTKLVFLKESGAIKTLIKTMGGRVASEATSPIDKEAGF
jgi:replicative DNA helicase